MTSHRIIFLPDFLSHVLLNVACLFYIWYMEEIWRTVPKYPGYKVSNLGRVKSHHSNTILKPQTNTYGYHHVKLSPTCVGEWLNPMGIKQELIHRIVLMTFDPHPNMSKLTVNHKNFDKIDNRLENLEWMTAMENFRHGQKGDRQPVGEDHKCAKLTEEDVREIREMSVNGISGQKIAEIYNMGTTQIWRITAGKSWKHI